MAKLTTKKIAQGKKDRPRIAKTAAAKPAGKTTGKPGKAGKVVRAKIAVKAKTAVRGGPTPPQPSVAAPARQPAPLPADPSRPVKNQAGLKARDLAFFRDLLLAKRRELVGDVHSMEQEALQASSGTNLSNLPIHMADMGTDNYEQEFTLGLVEKDRNLLREINVALGKIRDGNYGICEGTGKPITRARLEAQPWARYSIEHARQRERGMLRRP